MSLLSMPKNRILLAIGFVVSVALLLFGAYMIYLQMSQRDFSSRLIDVNGVVLNADNNNPIAGITAKIGDFAVETDKNGKFFFHRVSGEGVIIIEGSSLYESVEIPVENRESITVFVSSSLLNAVRDFENAERYRKYKDLYAMLSSNQKKLLGEKEFVKSKNSWRDQIVDSGGFTDFDIHIEEGSMSVDDSLGGRVASCVAEYKWGVERGSWRVQKKVIKFIREGNSWKLMTVIL